MTILLDIDDRLKFSIIQDTRAIFRHGSYQQLACPIPVLTDSCIAQTFEKKDSCLQSFIFTVTSVKRDLFSVPLDNLKKSIKVAKCWNQPKKLIPVSFALD